jgi:type IV pilus assembly protein PilQ
MTRAQLRASHMTAKESEPMNAHTPPPPCTIGRGPGLVHPVLDDTRGRGATRRLAQCAFLAALAAAGGVALAAAAPPVRLLGVSSRGNAVLIESAEPVAYSVTNPDPLTLVVDLRNVSVQDALNQVERLGVIAAVRLEQTTATDGKAVGRVRLSLARPSEYKVRSARNTIRVELSSLGVARRPTGSGHTELVEGQDERSPRAGAALGAASDAVMPPAGDAQTSMGGAPMATLLLAPGDNGTGVAEPEPAITLEQAIANAAAITPPQEVPDAMAALKMVPPSAAGVSPAVRRDPSPAAIPTPAPARPQAARQRPASPVLATSKAVGQQPQVTPSQQITGVPEKKYQGHPISMDFQGVDLRSVLRTFAEISGLNMVIDPDVQGTVDIVLNEVPWDQALEVILRGNQLDYTVDGTIVRIAKIDTLRKEQEQRQQLTKAMAEAGTLTFQTFSLSYAKAAAVAPLLTKSQLLSTRGQVNIDERTNTLIVADLAERFTGIRQLLQTLDRPEPQVEVEARVVQTTREFARAIGIQWGLNGRMTPDIGNTTNLAFPNRGTLGGRTGGVSSPVDPRATELETTANAVNLGVPGPSSAIGLALGAVNGAFNLDVALSALERTGKGRVLSTPRLTTQNNIEAEVAQGIQIPIQTVANNTVTVTFKEAVLLLKVNPQITSAGTVIMRITIENASADFSRQVNGIPPIDTQRANTQVQVDDGATTVIGGIFVSREQNSIERTPLLHRIPLLGWLFRRDTNSDESRELLIFITPRILKS